MGRRAVLRADAGGATGFGHFVRTVALASCLRDRFECVVASHNPNGVLSPWQLGEIAAAGAVPMLLGAGTREAFDAAFADALRPDDLVVLDNYYFDTDYQRLVRSRCAALVCIDDEHTRHFVADAVVSFCPLPSERFSLEPYTRYFSGLEWAFLRQPFLSAPPVRTPVDRPRHIVVAIGGTDPLGLTEKVCGIVADTFPEATIHLTGDRDYGPRTKPHGRLDAAGMAALFDNCDLGIFPASTLCVEAMSRRLPVAAGWFADNQRDFYEAGTSRRWFADLGCLTDAPEEIAARLRAATLGGLPQPPAIDFTAARRHIAETLELIINY